MRIAYSIAFTLVAVISSYGQNTFRAVVKDRESKEALPGASVVVAGTTIGAATSEEGLVKFHNVPDGQQTIVFSFLGYESESISRTFPTADTATVEIFLAAGHEELEDIVITSTRSTRTIADIPTRVEFIAGEEIDEKANMKPGDIRMLLSESTGIQTQQTSATSANASIRIQGLDGRYTQILKDGFPLYSGFAGGLGLLQTPPLDLKQVEVIKGSSSTLYGGGAIAGLVNLISRVPTEESDLRFMINATSAKGLDLSGFYGKQFGKFGMTLFATRNSSEAYDPADVDLTAIPEYERYSFTPRFFFDLTEKTKINASISFTTEDRIGGDIHYIEGNGDVNHSYFEENDSKRVSTLFALTHRISENSSLNLKNSFNQFDRLLRIPTYTFDGSQVSTFTELNFVSAKENIEWVGGLNLWTEDFSERLLTGVPARDYQQTTIGVFAQNTIAASEKVSIESGLRGDYVVDYGVVWLPRVSVLLKASEKFSTRIGGGFGYKAPTIFTEESERIQFQNVLPISSERNELERSYGANWDLNYRTNIGELGFNLNHLFFYTYLDNPLMLEAEGEMFQFVNINGFTDTKGIETNLKLEYGDFKLFLGYTFTDARVHEDGRIVQNPLTPKHRMNNVLMYEVEEKWKIGLEGYYFGKQRLNDGSYGKDYWICGFMVEKLWERFSVFINFENFLDARQTRFDTIYTGTLPNPVFRDIYAPLDGFVINGGLKIDL